jgi:putative redox protein
MSITATAQRTGGGLRHEIDVNGRHTIWTDEPKSLGGTDTGPAPHELLPAALAGCIATMIALYAEPRGWALGDVVVDVDYDTEADPRSFEIEVQLPADLTAEQVARLRHVVETCPVRRALDAGFRLEERVMQRSRNGGRPMTGESPG